MLYDVSFNAQDDIFYCKVYSFSSFFHCFTLPGGMPIPPLQQFTPYNFNVWQQNTEAQQITFYVMDKFKPFCTP